MGSRPRRAHSRLGGAGCRTNLITDPLKARREALSIWDAAGDRFRSRETHRWLSRLHWFAGYRDLAWEHAWLAVQKLGGTDSAELAMAYSNLAQLRMVASDLPGTQHWTSRAGGAGSPAGRHGHHGIRVQAWNNLGCAEATAGAP